MPGINKLCQSCTALAILMVGGILLSSCATSSLSRARAHIEKNEFQQAIDLLTTDEAEKPDDARIKTELGVAYYKSNQIDKAVAKLKEAKALNPKDAKAVFYLGLSYEKDGLLTEAIEEYKSYRNLGRSRGFKKRISQRIKQLTNEKVAAEVARAISEEQTLNVADIPDNTIAVLYFENLSNSPELDPLRKGLAQMLITDLSKVESLTIVERLKLQKLLEELKLGETGLVDKSTAPRVGKLIGAKKLVVGGFTELENKNLRIDASINQIATSDISNLEEVSGQLRSFFQMEKKLAFAVIQDMGITLTREEREAIEKIPTESLLAFMAYAKGLDYEDRGMFDAAKTQYQKALGLDPNFQLARSNYTEVDAAKSAATEPKAPPQKLETEYESADAGADTPAKSSRLHLTGLAASTGQMPQGDNDSREPVQEATGTDQATPSAAVINVVVPLPPDGN